MAEKDPKDMTVAELLRWAANEEFDEYGNTIVSSKLFAALSGKPYSDTDYDEDARNIRALADRIDAEIEAARMDARNESFYAGFDARIALYEYPLRKDEGFNTWLQRCFIQRPVDEDNEPVQFGDEIELHYWDGGMDKGRFQEVTVNRGPVCVLSFTGTDHTREYRYYSECDVIKRPAPEALGADGKPIVAGETVYPISGDWIGDPLEVAGIDRDGSVRVYLSEGKGFTCYLADRLTHALPDTQERIDGDVQKDEFEYWGCLKHSCDSCPVLIDGDKPWQRYDAACCEDAMMFDLLRRQRELDARKGGE